MARNTLGKAYKLPETIDPGSLACIRAYVPNDPLYIAAWWSSYQFLTSWLAWEPNDDKDGKEAADVWKIAFNKARDEWLLGDGACGIAPVADSEPVADLILDVLWGVSVLIGWIHQWLILGKTATQIKAYLSYLTPWLPGLPDMIDLMAASSTQDRQDAIDAWDWESVWGDVWCDDACDASNYDGPFDFIPWSQCVIARLDRAVMNIAGIMADWIQQLSADVINAMGIGALANLEPRGGQNFGFDEPSCPWSHEFDFTVSNGGFTDTDRYGAQWQCGVWSDGVGWVTEDMQPDMKRRQAIIRRQFDTAHLVKFEVHYTLSKGTWVNNSVAHSGRFYAGDVLWDEEFIYWDDLQNGSWWKVYEYDGDVTEIEAWVSSCKNNDDWDGSVVIDKIIVYGVDFNPFA
jgi:hypothetical protein